VKGGVIAKTVFFNKLVFYGCFRPIVQVIEIIAFKQNKRYHWLLCKSFANMCLIFKVQMLIKNQNTD
jgi:hypothetical protein